MKVKTKGKTKAKVKGKGITGSKQFIKRKDDDYKVKKIGQIGASVSDALERDTKIAVALSLGGQPTYELDDDVIFLDNCSASSSSSLDLRAQQEKEKKGNYLQSCLEMWKDFTPLVYNVNGVAGCEACSAEK